MKKLEKITPQKEDFSRWYTDVIKNGDLMAYSGSKGSIIFKPISFAIWDNIHKNLDILFETQNVENVYLPLLIPESLLQKEKDHLSGFNPELATVTEVGGKKLNEKYFIRPTSETLFGDFFKNEIESYNDLPLIYNQWANVLRWEKTTNPFLRTREFMWQEGHTIHANANEAKKLTLEMLKIYKHFVENYLAIYVLDGYKTEHEKFAGAEFTLTIEAMMKDGKALQSGTSHYLAQNFTKVFDVKFKNKVNEYEYAYGTSWGLSTRLIGALIMAHGDDRGIVIPPKIAPTQIDIIELFASKEPKVHKLALQLQKLLSKQFSVKIDDSDKNPGFKAANSEIHGTPLKIEIGPKDVANNQVILVRRDTLVKQNLDISNLKDFVKQVSNVLDDIQTNLFNESKKRTYANFIEAKDFEEFKKYIAQNKWVVTHFAGNADDELAIKEQTGASSRCIPFECPINLKNNNCFYTGKKTDKIVIFAKAY